jgi:hypothetical protein
MATLDETFVKLAHGFLAYMRPNEDPVYPAQVYGIRVTDFSPDQKAVFLTFSFRTGQRYCCDCSACHHGLLFDSDYERLRESFRQNGVEVGCPMRIHMHVVCEAGALFDFGPRAGTLPPAYEQIERAEWDEVYDERKAQKAHTPSL